MNRPVDFVVPSFGERAAALFRTVAACLGQDVVVHRVWVVDDASALPIRRQDLPDDARVVLLVHDTNRGISAARMTAIAQSSTDYVACVNVDVLPAPDWASKCMAPMRTDASIGAVYGRLVPHDNSLLARWRMRFQETNYDCPSGSADFAPGHAVLFRRMALDAVGGYEPSLRRVGEDSDISHRLRRAGWDTHYERGARVVSIQDNSLPYLAYKQAIRGGFDPALGGPRLVDYRNAIRDLSNRLARNLARLRLSFLPVDIAVFALTIRYLGLRHFDVLKNSRTVRSHGTPE